MASSQKNAKKSAVRSASRPASKRATATAPSVAIAVGAVDVRAIRQSLGLTRKIFSRLSHFSERAIADWEGGESLRGQSRQKMVELKRLQEALATVIEPDFIGEWLQTPNDAFEGLKPLEVIERGQTDRLWRMIFVLESGVPS